MSDIDPNAAKAAADSISSGWLITLLLGIIVATWTGIKKLGFVLIGRHIKHVDDMEIEHKKDIVHLHERVDDTVKIFMGEHAKTQEQVEAIEKEFIQLHKNTKDAIDEGNVITESLLNKILSNQERGSK